MALVKIFPADNIDNCLVVFIAVADGENEFVIKVTFEVLVVILEPALLPIRVPALLNEKPFAPAFSVMLPELAKMS